MVTELVAGLLIGFGIGYGRKRSKLNRRRRPRDKRRTSDMADEAKDGGLVFHPMDQFIVKPLFGDGPVGMFTITNSTMWMALSILAVIALLVLGTRSRAIVQLSGPAAHGLHTHLAYRRDRRAGCRRVPRRDCAGFRQKRRFFPEPVLGVFRAAGAAAYSGADRGDQLLRAPRQPLHSFGGPKFSRPSPPWWRSRRCRFWRSPQCMVWRCWLPAFRPMFSPF